MKKALIKVINILGWLPSKVFHLTMHCVFYNWKEIKLEPKTKNANYEIIIRPGWAHLYDIRFFTKNEIYFYKNITQQYLNISSVFVWIIIIRRPVAKEVPTAKAN